VVPALVYLLRGTSRDLAVGCVVPWARCSSRRRWARRRTRGSFFAGALLAALGVLRLGLVVDFLSHAGIVGFMGGCAVVVCAQQLKGFLGVRQSAHALGLPSIVRALLSQSHQVDQHPFPSRFVALSPSMCTCLTLCGFLFYLLQWRWEPAVLGCCLLFVLQITRYFVSTATTTIMCLTFFETTNKITN
jgi:sulfate transporter 3